MNQSFEILSSKFFDDGKPLHPRFNKFRKTIKEIGEKMKIKQHIANWVIEKLDNPKSDVIPVRIITSFSGTIKQTNKLVINT